PVLRFDMGAGIDVGGGAEALRESGQCHALREELTVAVREGLHGDASLQFESIFGTFFGGRLVIRQIQRAFLAAAGEHGTQHGECDKRKQQTLHGGKFLEKINVASIPSARWLAYVSGS